MYVNTEIADKYQEFFNFMSQEYDLTLTISEMDEIVSEAQKLVKKLAIPLVGQSLPTDSEIEEMANEIPVFPPLNVAKEHRAKWIQGAKALRDKLAKAE